MRLTVFAPVCILLSSCAHTVPVEALALSPVIEQAPIAVTVVYDDALRDFRCTASKGYIADEWLIELGPASVATFTPVFHAMFADIRVLPAGAAATGDRYVVTLSLDEYTGCDVAWPIIGSPVAIAYSARLTRGADMLLEAWTGSGESLADDIITDESPAMNIDTYLARLTTLAIRRAVADFLWKFEEDERVLAWKSAAIADAP